MKWRDNNGVQFQNIPRRLACRFCGEVHHPDIIWCNAAVDHYKKGAFRRARWARFWDHAKKVALCIASMFLAATFVGGLLLLAGCETAPERPSVPRCQTRVMTGSHIRLCPDQPPVNSGVRSYDGIDPLSGKLQRRAQ